MSTAPWTFDPDHLGRLEADVWSSYYRREWTRLLRGAVGLVRTGFGMGRLDTLRGAWWVLRANQVWAPYPDNDPDAARELMRRFYALVRDRLDLTLDPVRAADLEVEWWRVHRLHQHGDPIGASRLTDALAALYAYVYVVPHEDVRAAADLRREAMDVSDAWVLAGRDRGHPLFAQEQRLLVSSYTTLRGVLDQVRPG